MREPPRFEKVLHDLKVFGLVHCRSTAKEHMARGLSWRQACDRERWPYHHGANIIGFSEHRQTWTEPPPEGSTLDGLGHWHIPVQIVDGRATFCCQPCGCRHTFDRTDVGQMLVAPCISKASILRNQLFYIEEPGVI